VTQKFAILFYISVAVVLSVTVLSLIFTCDVADTDPLFDRGGD